METTNKNHAAFVKQRQQKINECLNLVRVSNRKINVVRSSAGESETHKQMKEEMCKILENQNLSYITEAIFKTGGRADILVLDLFKVIEKDSLNATLNSITFGNFKARN